MAGRFYMRFNLQNGEKIIPPSVETFEKFLPHTREEMLPEWEDFERIQTERVERLCRDCAGEIERIRGCRVLFLGDSITSDNLGYRTSVSRAAALDSIEGAVSGSTTASLMPHVLRLLEESAPQLVSLMIGSNDSVIEQKPGEEEHHLTSLADYEANLRIFFDAIRKSGAKLLLLSVPQVHEERFAPAFRHMHRRQTNASVASYNEVLSRVAAEYGDTPIPHSYFAQYSSEELLEKDGIHLSPFGQECLARVWLREAAARL